MNTVQCINKLANKVLQRDMKFPEDMPLGYLLGICVQRGIMLLRGVCTFPVRYRFMRGKRVSIRCKSKIHLGVSVTFQDEVEVDALSREGIYLGDYVTIGKRSIIRTSGSVTAIGKGFKMGHHSSFGNDCFVGAAGGVEIGNYCAFGQNVRFHSENHRFDDPNKPIHEQGVTNKGIKIGNDCWIGAGAVFLDGVTVGDGCVIGANSVVTRDVASGAVVAGAPARVIRCRINGEE